MNDLLKYVLYKIFAVAIVLFVMNFLFIFVYNSVFEIRLFTITIIGFNLFVALDKIFQPSAIYGKKERARKDLKQIFLLIVFLLLNPLLLVLPFLEYTYFMKNILLNDVRMVFWIIGSIFLIIGGTILSYGRYIIGKQGTTVIGIESDHKLIITGPYRYVRHPIYGGAILLFLGFGLSFSGIFSTILFVLFLVFLFQKRINTEEKLLIDTFGKEYQEYMKHTKKFIPLVY